MTDVNARSKLVEEIAKLEARSVPLSEFEIHRLKTMKSSLEKMDDSDDIEVEIIHPITKKLVKMKVITVRPPDLDDDGDFSGK